MGGETDKAKHIIAPMLTGSVLDLGSNGWPVIDHAIQVDVHRFHRPPHPPVQVVCDAFGKLPFPPESFDAVVASHILEDAKDWDPILRNWASLVKPSGFLIIQVPDHVRFRAAVAAGQGDNLAHLHESRVGELTEYMTRLGGFEVIMDRFEPEGDYNILAIFKRI